MPTQPGPRTADLARKTAATRDVNGWLGIDKPEGMTSADVVAGLKRLLMARKVGHAGTLDRPATGVLALAFGEATKTIPHVMDSRKEYSFLVRFGQATTTDDATGDVVAESDQRPAAQDIRDVLHRFRGDILQRPPSYSAVKVSGKRAAALASSGVVTELKPRPLKVYKLELVGMVDEQTAEFEFHCGKGGYVRSIARDLGSELGCPAHVRSLRRLAAGPFRIEDCIALARIRELDPQDLLEHSLLPIEFGLSSLSKLNCTETEASRIRKGIACRLEPGPCSPKAGSTVWVACSGWAIAMGEYRNEVFYPKRVFKAVSVF